MKSGIREKYILHFGGFDLKFTGLQGIIKGIPKRVLASRYKRVSCSDRLRRQL